MKTIKKSALIVSLIFVMIFGSVMTSEAAVAMNDPVFTPTSETSFTVKWSSFSGATQYAILYYPKGYTSSDSKFIDVGNRTSYTFSGLPKDSVYFVGIAAYDSAGDFIAGTHFVPCITKPGKPVSIKPGGWESKKVQFITPEDPYPNTVSQINYQILNSAGSVVKQGETPYTTFVVSGVPATKVYKVRIRYKSGAVDGKYYYGDWSDTKWVVPQPIMNNLKMASKTKNKLKVSWKKVAGATKYVVYGSTKPNSGYKKIKELKASKTSLVVSKVRGKKLKKYQNYYFKVVAYKGKIKSTDNNYKSGYIYTTYR